jgi:hypothetical protein
MTMMDLEPEGLAASFTPIVSIRAPRAIAIEYGAPCLRWDVPSPVLTGRIVG